MQRNNDNKYSSEDNAFVTKPPSANVIENLNATSSHDNQNPTAKAMRSGQQHEVAYEVAGPTVGGMAPQVTSYNQYNITDSMSKAKISEGTLPTTTTTIKPVGASSIDSISKAGAKAAGAVGAVSAGAAAAGGDLANAAKNLVSHHDTPEGSLESPHPHPITYMPGKTTESQTATTSDLRSASKPAFVEPIHSTGLNNPIAPTHHHTTQNIPKGEVVTAGPPSHSSSNVGLAKMIPNSTTPTLTPAEEKHLHEHRSSIKDKVKNVFRRRSSAQAAAEAEAAAAAAAEAAKTKSYDARLDRFEAIPETPYTSSGAPKADLHAAPGKPAVKLDAHPTTTLNQGHNSRRHERSTPDLAMSKTSTTSSSSSVSSRPLSEKITTPVVGTAATIGAAAAGTSAYLSTKAKDAKDAAVDSTSTSTCSNKSVPPTPYSTPVVNTSSTYAPATTLPAVERTSVKTTGITAEPSRSLSEKITAPLTGAAATVGAAAAGTTMYLSSKSKDGKDTAVGTTSNLAHSSKPTAHTTTTYSTLSANVINPPAIEKTNTATAKPFRPLTEKVTAPVVGAATAVGAAATGTAAYVGNKVKDAKDTAVGSSNNLTHGQRTTTTSYTTPAANASYSAPAIEKTPVTTAHSRPLTEKITAPVVGAAAAGTAAYMGNKAKDAKDTATSGNAHNSSSYTTTTTTGTPAPTAYSKTTSSSGAAPVLAKSADKIAIPASYKGPIPTAGPGEQVVWVKTTTTTDYYDTDKGEDKNGDVVETHQNVLNPNSFQTEHDNVTTYVNDGHGGKHLQK
ncbi:hypothetical protein BGZ93_008045 [Podila epicladia]|nr:hypothetical protein BGZ93_008045 [Podila epicladia]